MSLQNSIASDIESLNSNRSLHVSDAPVTPYSNGSERSVGSSSLVSANEQSRPQHRFKRVKKQPQQLKAAHLTPVSRVVKKSSTPSLGAMRLVASMYEKSHASHASRQSTLSVDEAISAPQITAAIESPETLTMSTDVTLQIATENVSTSKSDVNANVDQSISIATAFAQSALETTHTKKSIVEQEVETEKEASIVAEPEEETIIVAEPEQEASIVAEPEQEASIVAESEQEASIVAEPEKEASIVAEPEEEASIVAEPEEDVAQDVGASAVEQEAETSIVEQEAETSIVEQVHTHLPSLELVDLLSRMPLIVSQSEPSNVPQCLEMSNPPPQPQPFLFANKNFAYITNVSSESPLLYRVEPESASSAFLYPLEISGFANESIDYDEMYAPIKRTLKGLSLNEIENGLPILATMTLDGKVNLVSYKERMELPGTIHFAKTVAQLSKALQFTHTESGGWQFQWI